MFKKIYDNGGKYFILFLIFNIVFYAFSLSLKYALPFVISLLLTAWLKPITTFIHNKTKFNRNIINILSIIFSLSLLIGAFTLVGIGMVKETSSIVSELSYIDMDFINSKITEVKGYIDSVPFEINNQITNSIQGFTGHIATVVSALGNCVIKIASVIPAVIINILIIILCTYYLLRDSDSLINSINNSNLIKSDVPKKMLTRVNSIIITYIQSYSILLSITFLECIVVFKIFDVKYLFTLSVLCVILDLMPIVGSALIYFPLAFMFFVQGKYAAGIWFIILYALFMIIRNILEPKLLSKSLELHPILILMSLYVGVSVNGIMGIIYCIFLITYFKLLKELNIV